MARRIVVEMVEMCAHGRAEPHWTEGISKDGLCAAPKRRVLDPGSFVLIEKVDGEWPEWIEDEGFKLKIHDVMRRLFVNVAPLWRNTTATSHHHPNYAPSLVSEILDALAGGEQP